MEKQMTAVARIMKRELKKENINSTLPHKPRGVSRYPFYIGNSPGNIIFKDHYLFTRLPIRFADRTPPYKQILRYLELVIEKTEVLFAGVVSLFNEDWVPLLEEKGFLPNQKELAFLIPHDVTYFYAPQGEQLVRHARTLNAFTLFLKRMAKHRSNFRFELAKGPYLWAFSFYHSGHEGLAYVESDGERLWLKEDTLQFVQEVKKDKPLFPQFRSLFTEAEDSKRLTNLMQPNSKLFVERLRKEKIADWTAEAIFRKLATIMRFEEIEEQLPTSRYVKMRRNETPILFSGFLDHYFIFHSYDLNFPVQVFPKEDKEQALSTYRNLCINYFNDNLDDTIKVFNKAELSS